MWEGRVLQVDKWEQLFLFTGQNWRRKNRWSFPCWRVCPALMVDKDCIISSRGAPSSDWLAFRSSCWQCHFSPSLSSKVPPSFRPGSDSFSLRHLPWFQPHFPRPFICTLFFFILSIFFSVVYTAVHSSRLEYSTVIKAVTLELKQTLGQSPRFLMCDLRQLLNLPRPQFHYL